MDFYLYSQSVYFVCYSYISDYSKKTRLNSVFKKKTRAGFSRDPYGAVLLQNPRKLDRALWRLNILTSPPLTKFKN